MNSKVFEITHFQTIKVAKIWDFTIGITRKQNRNDFAGLTMHNKLSIGELPLLFIHIVMGIVLFKMFSGGSALPV